MIINTQPHDPTHCDMDGQPHRGPCVEEPPEDPPVDLVEPGVYGRMEDRVFEDLRERWDGP